MKDKNPMDQETALLTQLKKENEALKKEIQTLQGEVQEYNDFMKSLVKILDGKSGFMQSYVDRTVTQAMEIGKAIGLSEEDLRILRKAVLFRDLGKIKIPEAILNKPGKLTEEESTIMKKHPQFSAEIIAELKSRHRDKLIRAVQEHHERVDGKGYPQGKKGSEISLLAKIIAIVDFWNAIVSDRPYRKGLPLSEALSLIKVAAGSHLDPDLVRVFIEKGIYSREA
ncbi:MAG TPA: HD domain-containing phosphohydrolase [Candidatus Limnocylindrales bacterium]|nr:HD domain-containing phosphohydrolase [Candidatus Limnocylindrales bacterium]